MADGKPKILLLGDYSNCQNTLATGLRRLGCDVTVVSDGCRWMDCDRQITLRRKPGKLGALEYAARIFYGLSGGNLSGYDIVSVHDPHFVDLRPGKIRFFFDMLRRRNRSVFLSAMSTDIAYLDMLEAPDSPLRYSEWFVDGKPSRWMELHRQRWNEWHGRDLVDYQTHFFDNIDGAVSVLYEYQLGMERRLGADRSAYGGIPVDTELYTPVQLPEKIGKVRLFLGRDKSRMVMKGTDLLEAAARAVVERHPDKAELVIVENVPFGEFTELLKSAHVVLDQIYSYTPATTALMAMAYGLNVVSGGEPEYYDFIGEKENRPIINAPTDIEPLTDAIERIVLNPSEIRERGRRSREFVVRHNSCETVAHRFLDFWLSKQK